MNRPGRTAVLMLAGIAIVANVGCQPAQPPLSERAQPLPAKAAPLPQLSKPVSQAALAAGIKRGLRAEVEMLRQDWSSAASSTALDHAQAGAPLAIRMVDSRKIRTALHESSDSTLVAYTVPVTLDGVPVGEFEFGVSGSRLTDLGTSSGPTRYNWYAAGARSLVATLGPDAQIFGTPPPAMAVIGWSQKGEMVVFVSLMDGAVAKGELTQPELGRLYTGDQALRYVSKFWIPR